MAKQTIKVMCPSCGGTGVYCGFAEPKGVGVVCVKCDGTGCADLSYEPFTKRQHKMTESTKGDAGAGWESLDDVIARNAQARDLEKRGRRLASARNDSDLSNRAVLG
jgi:hypothetical protein